MTIRRPQNEKNEKLLAESKSDHNFLPEYRPINWIISVYVWVFLFHFPPQQVWDHSFYNPLYFEWVSVLICVNFDLTEEKKFSFFSLHPFEFDGQDRIKKTKIK